MEKTRQMKMLSIVALVLAITAMTLGYAAFSTTLNISSSATVTPNSDDFKVNVYGFETFDDFEQFQSNDLSIDGISLSDSSAIGIEESASAKSTIANINNSTHTITNIKAEFSSQRNVVTYPFIIKNEGKYDAYVDTSPFNDDSEFKVNPVCIPGEGATLELVNIACSNLHLAVFFVNPETGLTEQVYNQNYKIKVNEHIILAVAIDFNGSYPDGPFTAEFPEIKLNFSTAPYIN